MIVFCTHPSHTSYWANFLFLPPADPNPQRATAQPTAERLLEAFDEITLTVVANAAPILRHLTPLSPLQFRIVARHGTLKTHGRTESVWETDFPLRKGHNTFE